MGKSRNRKRTGRKAAGERQERSPASFRAEALLAWVLPVLVVVLSFARVRTGREPGLVRLLIAGGLLVPVFAYLGLARRQLSQAARPVLASLGGYLACALAAAAFSFFPAANAGGLSWLFIYLSLFLAAAHLPCSRFFLPAWLGCGLVLGVMAILDAHRAGEMVYLPLMQRAMPRFVTPLGNRNFFAGYLALLAPSVLALGCRHWRNFTVAGRPQAPGRRAYHAFAGAFSFLCLAFFLFLLVKVGSRAALGGALAGMLVFCLLAAWFLLAGKLAGRFKRVIFAFFLVLLLVGALWQGAVRTIGVVSGEIRRHIFSGTVEMIRSRPWTGYGPGAYTAAFQQFRPPGYYLGPAAAVTDQSHNEFLQVAAETGLPSLLFFLAAISLVFLISWRALSFFALRARENAGAPGRHLSRDPPMGGALDSWFLLAGFLSGVVALLADGVLSSNLRTHTVGPLFWVILGLCACFSAGPGLFSPLRPGLSARGGAGTAATWFLAGAACLLAMVVFARQMASGRHHDVAEYHRWRNNPRAAAWHYRRAIEIDPSYALRGYFALGIALLGQGDDPGAIEAFSRLVRLSPNYADVYDMLGSLHMRAGNYEKALESYRSHLKYRPDDENIERMARAAENRLRRRDGAD